MAKDEPGTVHVSRGYVIAIDPSWLFTEREWNDEVVPLARELGDYPRAILELLQSRMGMADGVAVVVKMRKGDHETRMTKAGLVIES